MATIKFVKARLKNSESSAGIAPVIGNIHAAAGTTVRCVFPMRVTEFPFNRTAATWFTGEKSDGNPAGMVQTLLVNGDRSGFTINRAGSKFNGAVPSSSTVFKLNQWYIVETFATLTGDLAKIVLGATSNNNNQVSADFGEGMTLYLKGATDEVVNAKVAELKLKYGIAD